MTRRRAATIQDFVNLNWFQFGNEPIAPTNSGEATAAAAGRADKQAFDVAATAAVKENPKWWLAGVERS
jgi:hypothetical protein